MPYDGAAVTGLTNLLYEVALPQIKIQPVTRLLQQVAMNLLKILAPQNSVKNHLLKTWGEGPFRTFEPCQPPRITSEGMSRLVAEGLEDLESESPATTSEASLALTDRSGCATAAVLIHTISFGLNDIFNPDFTTS